MNSKVKEQGLSHFSHHLLDPNLPLALSMYVKPQANPSYPQTPPNRASSRPLSPATRASACQALTASMLTSDRHLNPSYTLYTYSIYIANGIKLIAKRYAKSILKASNTYMQLKNFSAAEWPGAPKYRWHLASPSAVAPAVLRSRLLVPRQWVTSHVAPVTPASRGRRTSSLSDPTWFLHLRRIARGRRDGGREPLLPIAACGLRRFQHQSRHFRRPPNSRETLAGPP